jgi:hypothetical protein
VGAYLLLKPKELKPRGQSINYDDSQVKEFKTFEPVQQLNRPVKFGVVLNYAKLLPEDQRKEFFEKLTDKSGFTVEIMISPGWTILRSNRTPLYNVSNNYGVVEFELNQTNTRFNSLNTNREVAARGYLHEEAVPGQLDPKTVVIFFKFNKDNSGIGFVAKHQVRHSSTNTLYSETGTFSMEVKHAYEAVKIWGQ